MSRSTLTIKELVQGFAKHIKQLKAPEYQESQLRLQYLDPFWKLLGWDVANDAQLPLLDVEVVIEPSMDSVDSGGIRSRKPDYLFRVNSFSRFIAEAKKPAVDIDTDKKAIFQAKSYAWNATIPFAVLTDFEQFLLYDTTLKPILNDSGRGLIKDFSFSFQDYPDKWEEIVATFGRNAVADGSLERLRAKIRKVPRGRRLRTVDRMLIDLRGDEPVDKVFLDYLEKYRQHFARRIYHDNKGEFPDANTLHGAARLTEAVQRLIDRLVFMRVCEDRGISRYGKLKETLDRISSEGGDFYAALIQEFRQLDREYNGYLFKFHFSETLTVSDDVLADFIRNLYPPDGPWDFSAIADDILGIVYERFLGNIVTVKHGHASVEEKPEVRHAGGVYYTPRFVVDTIIRRVVGPQIEGKTPAQLLDVKLLDPACGSGSFLVAAFQYLIDHAISAVTADPSLASVPATPKARKKRKEIAFKDSKGVWHLAPDYKAAILTNCIHGVDIDQQAVEVTVMSLYLKMLEGQLPPNWQKDWLENELLPSLDNNILCGNSLINTADFDRYLVATEGDLLPMDDDIRFRMNRFDWESRTRGFGRLLDSQAAKERGRAGFDCIIGNPPYIRVQELMEWAKEECGFYRWRYDAAKNGNFDIYVVFVERCLELLASDGLLGFIMPHKFWQAQYGKGLRKVISEGKYLRSVLDFGDQQVFHGATTYTAVHVLGKSDNNATIDYVRVLELVDGASQCLAIDAGSKSDGIERFTAVGPSSPKPWGFRSPAVEVWCQNVERSSSPLSDVAQVFVGVQTSADDIYHLDVVSRLDDVISVRSRTDDQVHELESWILKPLVSGTDTRAFMFELPRQVILYPYDWNISTSPVLYSEPYLKKNAPAAFRYLQAHEETLRGRERRSFDDDRWYRFGRSQNIGRQQGQKLCIPRLAERIRSAFDDTGSLCLDNVDVNGIRLREDQGSLTGTNGYLFLLALLNSSLAEKYIRATVSTHFRGGFASYNRQFIEELPIKLPETAAEKKLAERIVSAVRGIMGAKVKLRDGKLSDRERRTLEGDVENLEQRIDQAVFDLYGVEGLPS